MQITAISSGAEYAAGQAFVGGTLYLNGPTFLSSTTGQAVWGAVAGTGDITEGTAVKLPGSAGRSAQRSFQQRGLQGSGEAKGLEFMLVSEPYGRCL